MPTQLILEDTQGNCLVINKRSDNLFDNGLTSFWVIEETSEFFPFELAEKLDQICLRDEVPYDGKVFHVMHIS